MTLETFEIEHRSPNGTNVIYETLAIDIEDALAMAIRSELSHRSAYGLMGIVARKEHQQIGLVFDRDDLMPGTPQDWIRDHAVRVGFAS